MNKKIEKLSGKALYNDDDLHLIIKANTLTLPEFKKYIKDYASRPKREDWQGNYKVKTDEEYELFLQYRFTKNRKHLTPDILLVCVGVWGDTFYVGVDVFNFIQPYLVRDPEPGRKGNFLPIDMRILVRKDKIDNLLK